MEINFKTAALKKLVVHYVGSKNNLDPLILSEQALELGTEDLSTIGESFLHKFNSLFEWHSFQHPSSLQYNEVYNYVKEIFSNSDSFENASVNIAKHLYESSTHPKVKGGELYVGFF